MKNIVYNHKKYKTIRRNLRKQEVSSEKILWSRLRNKQQKFRFRRQYGIGKYIVDFYCPKLKLAIEIDGVTHSKDEEIKNDLIREKFLNRFGVEIKRYTNNDVYNYLENVLADIYEFCLEKEKKLL
ncbi:MAG: endonuclease domain-containing protein [Patescibacteria group bacterium]